MTLDQNEQGNEFGLASFFSDGTSQEQHPGDPPTSPRGETSEAIVVDHEISDDVRQRRKTLPRVTIDVLPKDVLFEIFNVYRLDSLEHARLAGRPWEWHRLAQVCQRWRSVLFKSSRYLEMKVFCTYGTPVREILSSSLDLPIIVKYGGFPESRLLSADDEDAIIALLGHPTRICEFQVTATAPLFQKMALLVQRPFSALEYLQLSARTEPGPVLPSEIGDFPCLRTLVMVRVALPSMPRLLLLAQALVSLQLEDLPSIGYTLEALLVCLPAMTRLKTLRIHFLSPSSRPVLLNTLHSPEECSVLHCLNYIDFHGTSEYLECLLSTISAPFLKYIHIAFFNQLIFHTLQLSQFILRTKTQHSPNQATIHYFGAETSVGISQAGMPHHLGLRILCRPLDWQISSIAEICQSLFPSLSHVAQLHIGTPPYFPGAPKMVHSQFYFLDLFRQFVNVKRLFLTGESVLHVASALERITWQSAVTVLPELREIYVGNHAELAFAQGGFATFIAARKYSTNPVFIRSLRAEPSRIFQSLPDFITPVHTPPIERDHSFPNTRLDIQGTRLRPHSASPHLVVILQMARLTWGHLDMHPGRESETNLPQGLAFPAVFRLAGEVVQTTSIPALLLRNGMVAMYERFGMEWRWETFTRMWVQSFRKAAYRNTLSSLRSFLVAGLTTPLLYTLGPLGQSLRIPLEYSSHLIERGQLESAIETIEQGKEFIWSETSELYSSMGQLQGINPDLADRLADLNQALKEIIPPISADHGGADAFAIAAAFEELYTLLMGHQEVIQQIRALPDFANFMKAVPFRTLQTAAIRGPIIIVNHCRLRCDILIVLDDSPPSLIPTEEGFYERASNLASQLKESRRKHGLDSKDYDDVLANVLAELYKLVGRPVISRLRELGIPEQSRIWWYPTSVFWSLPLHAMGPVPSTDDRDLYFSDMYVCSYTPTLGALIPSLRFPGPKTDPQYSLLLVAQPDLSLPGVRGEIQVVHSLPIPVTALLSQGATPSAIIETLQSHTLVHFACHGIQEAGEPLKAAFKLRGSVLTLHDIANSRPHPAELAFLSADHSAEPTDVGDPDAEGLNIAATMQYHGFGSVVGAMWAMADTDGPEISKHFYASLFAGDRRRHDTPLGERSAEALQLAVRKLRRKRGMTLERWVCWVHYGA